MKATCGYGHKQINTVPIDGVTCPAQEAGWHCTAILLREDIWRALKIIPDHQESCIIHCPNPRGLRPHDVVCFRAYNPDDHMRHDKTQLQAVAEFELTIQHSSRS